MSRFYPLELKLRLGYLLVDSLSFGNLLLELSMFWSTELSARANGPVQIPTNLVLPRQLSRNLTHLLDLRFCDLQ